MSILVLQPSGWGREMVALLSLSSWCLVIVVWLFLAVPWVCLQFVEFPFGTYYLSMVFLSCAHTPKRIVLSQPHYLTRERIFHDFKQAIKGFGV